MRSEGVSGCRVVESMRLRGLGRVQVHMVAIRVGKNRLLGTGFQHTPANLGELLNLGRDVSGGEHEVACSAASQKHRQSQRNGEQSSKRDSRRT